MAGSFTNQITDSCQYRTGSLNVCGLLLRTKQHAVVHCDLLTSCLHLMLTPYHPICLLICLHDAQYNHLLASASDTIQDFHCFAPPSETPPASQSGDPLPSRRKTQTVFDLQEPSALLVFHSASGGDKELRKATNPITTRHPVPFIRLVLHQLIATEKALINTSQLSQPPCNIFCRKRPVNSWPDYQAETTSCQP